MKHKNGKNKFTRIAYNAYPILPMLIIIWSIDIIFDDEKFNIESIFEGILLVTIIYTVYFIFSIMIIKYKYWRKNRKDN